MITGKEPSNPTGFSYAGDGTGLTKREYFAAKAMIGYINAEPDRGHEYIADDAVRAADALIKALNEGEGK